jgi:hypothetical protein
MSDELRSDAMYDRQINYEVGGQPTRRQMSQLRMQLEAEKQKRQELWEAIDWVSKNGRIVWDDDDTYTFFDHKDKPISTGHTPLEAITNAMESKGKTEV